MTVPRRHFRQQALTGFFAGMIGMILSVLISGPDTASVSLDIRWISATVLAYLMTSPAVVLGIFAGVPIGSLLILPASPFPTSGLEAFGQITCLTVAITLSSIIIRKKLLVKSPVYWALMIAILLVTGLWVLHSRASNMTFVFWGACILTGCLACLKNTRLANLPSLFFIAWVSGHSLWVASIAILGLDPSATRHNYDFIRRNWLMPFPLYVLLILIAVHLIHAFRGSQDDDRDQ